MNLFFFFLSGYLSKFMSLFIVVSMSILHKRGQSQSHFSCHVLGHLQGLCGAQDCGVSGDDNSSTNGFIPVIFTSRLSSYTISPFTCSVQLLHERMLMFYMKGKQTQHPWRICLGGHWIRTTCGGNGGAFIKTRWDYKQEIVFK